MKRIIIDNGMFQRIKGQLQCFPASSYEVVSELDFFSSIETLQDTVVLAYGYDFYAKLKESVSLGLRNNKYDDFCKLPVFAFGSNRLVYGRYPISNFVDGEYEQKPNLANPDEWIYIDPKVTLFFSNKVFKKFYEFIECKKLGLNDAVAELRENWIPYIGKEGMGIDFESSGFPDEAEFYLSGVGLASSKRNYTVWIDFRKDDGYNSKYDVRDHKEFMEAFHELVTKGTSGLWAYNCTFEIGALYYLFEEKIYIQDAYALTTCDNQKKSLKYNWQYYGLGTAWDTIEDAQRDVAIRISNYYKDGYKTYQEYVEAKNRMVDKYDEQGNVVGQWSEVEALLYNYGHTMDELPPEHMLEHFWGDEWLCVDPDVLGQYCSIDAMAGLKLAETLYPAYKYPYQVFLYNKYFAFELNQRKFDVNIKKRDEMREYCRNVQHNQDVFVDYFKALRVVETQREKWASIRNPPQMEWLLNNAPYSISPDPTEFAKNLIDQIMFTNKEAFDELDNHGHFNTHVLDEFVGYDYSAKLNFINDEYLTEEAWEQDLDENGQPILDDKGNPQYHSVGRKECICYPADQWIPHPHDGYKSFKRKRGMFKVIGTQLFADVLDIPKWLTQFNAPAMEEIKAAYQIWLDRTIMKEWPLSVSPIGYYYNLLDLRKIKNNGEPKYPNYEDWMVTPVSEEGFGITQKDFDIIKLMPQDLVDKTAQAIDINDPNLMCQDLQYALPEDVYNYVAKSGKLLNYTDYISYRKYLKLKEQCDAITPHSISECTDFERNYEPMVNIFSFVKDAPDYHNSFKNDMGVVKALACIRFYWEYRATNFHYIVPAYGHGRHQDANGDWVINNPPDIDYGPKGESIPCVPGSANYWDWPEFKANFEQQWESGNVHKTQIYKEMMAANWKTEIWLTDCIGSNLVYTAIIPIDDLKDTKMPEDMCQRICKWAAFYDIASSARKMDRSYVEQCYATCGIPQPIEHKWCKMEGIPVGTRDLHRRFIYGFNAGDEYNCIEYEPLDG